MELDLGSVILIEGAADLPNLVTFHKHPACKFVRACMHACMQVHVELDLGSVPLMEGAAGLVAPGPGRVLSSIHTQVGHTCSARVGYVP